MFLSGKKDNLNLIELKQSTCNQIFCNDADILASYEDFGTSKEKFKKEYRIMLEKEILFDVDEAIQFLKKLNQNPSLVS
ncbi:MAG: hypothetical protein CM15mP127_09100 [Gammaproteobacteria bacterium]|nr:MAG: hypothetical protein CM15mP127_09100 [Gammaproteobacteria bacterium]